MSATADQPGPDLIDVIAAVLLALAAVATAWSGYQASRWNGEQAKAGARSNALRLESTRASGLADAQTQIDVATFTAWVDAYARSETRLAEFYRRRFRAEFKPAVEAWIATRPLENRDAPLTPFAMPQYRLAARAEADALQTRADALAGTARSYVQRSTNYVLAVVLFSAALFFAGMSARLPARRVRIWLLGVGLVIFTGTLIWVAVSPVSVSV
ncbi:MAG TPA: hypothetical protein VL422_17245 [Miltoncostaea sp.]|nr:hypothetical protein [Miltoncostaea sp.]